MNTPYDAAIQKMCRAMCCGGNVCRSKTSGCNDADFLAEARAAAEAIGLREMMEALELYRDAVRIDVLMSGPRFMGSNVSALKRAWDNDQAALRKAKP